MPRCGWVPGCGVAVENSPEAQENGLLLGGELGDLVEAGVSQVDLVQHCVVAQLLVLNRHKTQSKPVRPFSRVPTSTFSVPGFFLWLRPRISSPCHRVRTTGKSERLINGVSSSYELCS